MSARHTWASAAAMNGVGMVTIAKLLGYALVESTADYSHLVEAAEKVGSVLPKAMFTRPT